MPDVSSLNGETRPVGEARGDALYLESLNRKHLPDQLTPAIFAETILHPEQFPIAARMLKDFGIAGKTTYETEYFGTNLPPEISSQVAKKYQDEQRVSTVDKPIPFTLSQPRSPRLQMLCASHADKWEGEGDQIYYIMSEVVGPALGFKYNLDPPTNTKQNGDFHLIARYIKENLGRLRPLFFDQKDVSTASAQIAFRGGVGINTDTVDALDYTWSQLLGPVNLEQERIKQGKLVDPTEEIFPRKEASSITRRFEQIFVNLNLADMKAVEETLGLEGMDKTGYEYITNHLNRLHMIMLGLAEDIGSYKPLERINQLTHIDPKAVGSVILEAVTLPASSDRAANFKAIDPKLGNLNGRDSANTLISETKKINFPGFGIARAVLASYTELKIKGDPRADLLEKVMQQFNRLATVADAKQKINLDSLFSK